MIHNLLKLAESFGMDLSQGKKGHWIIRRFNTFDMRIKLMRLRRDVDLAIEPHPIAEKEFNNANPLASEILKYGIPLI